jgi:hypothetical protein
MVFETSLQIATLVGPRLEINKKWVPHWFLAGSERSDSSGTSVG